MQAEKFLKSADFNHPDLNHPAFINIKKFTKVKNYPFIHDSSNNNVNMYLVPIAYSFKSTIVTRLQHRKKAAKLQPKEQTPAETPETLKLQKLRLSSQKKRSLKRP